MIADQQVNLARQDVVVNPSTAVGRCRHGTMLYLKHDVYVGRSLDQYGEFSEGEVAIFRQWIRTGDIVLDVGANIGAHTLPMAQLVGAIGFVHAFEPQRIIFHLLCANVALNELLNVQAHHAGVGAAAGSSKVPPLDYGGENNFAGVPIGSPYGEDVPIITVDSLQLPSLRFAKIDVEGMERDVLLGAATTIQQLRPVLYIENDSSVRSEAVVSLLFEFGYRVWWHPVPLFARDNFRNNPNNLFGNIVSLNVLCVPKEMDAPEPALREIRTAQDRWGP